jgi:hypothetical protein
MKMTTRSLVNGVALSSVATLALALGAIDRAQAATITTLFNTGVNTSGAVLPDGTIDSHYTLTAAPAGAGTAVARTAGYPAGGPWSGISTTSAWVGPNTTNFYGAPGDYTYTTTFDLTGFDASTANINGKWSTDNNGVAIKLNGNTVVLPASSLSNSYTTFSAFTISSGFLSGLNQLDFVVNNGPGLANNPTGLRVELEGTAAAVPEPSDLVGTAVAFGSVVLLKRKLTKKTLG